MQIHKSGVPNGDLGFGDLSDGTNQRHLADLLVRSMASCRLILDPPDASEGFLGSKEESRVLGEE